MTLLLVHHSSNSAVMRQPVRWALRLDAGRPVISVDIQCDISIKCLLPLVKGWPNSETRLLPGGHKGNRDTPLIQELVDKVKDAAIFTKFDVRTGYWNIRFKEGDEHKAAFKTNIVKILRDLGMHDVCQEFWVVHVQRLCTEVFLD